MISLIFRDFELSAGPIPTSPSGRAWFVLNGTSFPCDDWFDFPLSILGSAFDAYQQLAGGADQAVSYLFDGPYTLSYSRVSCGSGELVKVEAYVDDDDVSARSVMAEAVVSLAELRRALAAASSAMALSLASAEGADGENSRIVAQILTGLGQDPS